MKTRRMLLIFLVLATLAPVFLASVNVRTLQMNQIDTDISANLIAVGSTAPDWTMKELRSDVNKTFSVEYSGKVVMIDFFATWCGPCRDAMPYIKQINDYFAGEPKFVLMSISLDDPNYDEADLEQFANDYEMDWLIFHDKTRQVSDDYDISAIPTMAIISKTGYIYYIEEGFGGVDPLKAKVQTLLDLSDSAAPVVNEFTAAPSALSVLDNELTVTTNVTDALLRHLKLSLTVGGTTLTSDLWNPDSTKLTHSFNVNPVDIWDATQAGKENVTVHLLAEDYVGKSTTAELVVDLTKLTDSGPPTVSITRIEEIDSSIGQNFKIYASFADDLLLSNKSIQIWINDALAVEETSLQHDTGNVYFASFYSVPVTKKMTIEIKAVAKDVAGNAAEGTQTYVVTDNTGITFPLVLGGILLANLLLLPLYRKREQRA